MRVEGKYALWHDYIENSQIYRHGSIQKVLLTVLLINTESRTMDSSDNVSLRRAKVLFSIHTGQSLRLKG